ncbi:hypothetical protein K435DRAFT_861716 [Dendrothele bispora CBS 962.96]|uniref:GST N-terminal domain-containing protein n=1 Tax=Dendrothele bispora (strain CBS 962.96) TaxID=1314807 RepID=A0A4S8LUH3_DENBC|nr:hypothetical protein K435DRAFT_861716 [Dendrothele bispora CBS 962.96]
MTDSALIILYDFTSKGGKPAPWNPNTWKARYSLNYKGLAFKTIWLEYPDVEPTLKAAGVPPTGTRDGKPLYTLPAIVDPSTGAAVAESLLIAKYLDRTYQDKPSILPQSIQALQVAFLDILPTHPHPILQFTLQKITQNILSPESEIYCRMVWAAMPNVLPPGVHLDDAFPVESRTKEWEKLEKLFAGIAERWIGKETFITGATASFGDFALAGLLQCFKKAWGEGSEEWERVICFQGGRWKKFLEDLQQYE